MLGFFAVTPILFIAFVLAVIFGFRSATTPLGSIVMASAVAAVALYAVTTGYFLYLVHTDDRMDPSEKGRWTFMLLLWFPFAAPSFWYRFIWREDVTDRANVR